MARYAVVPPGAAPGSPVTVADLVEATPGFTLPGWELIDIEAAGQPLAGPGDAWDGVAFVRPEPPEPPRRYVSRFAIVTRLEAMDRLDDVLAVFDALPRALRERWAAAVEIWTEDPDTIATLTAAGLSAPEIDQVLGP